LATLPLINDLVDLPKVREERRGEGRREGEGIRDLMEAEHRSEDQL